MKVYQVFFLFCLAHGAFSGSIRSQRDLSDIFGQFKDITHTVQSDIEDISDDLFDVLLPGSDEEEFEGEREEEIDSKLSNVGPNIEKIPQEESSEEDEEGDVGISIMPDISILFPSKNAPWYNGPNACEEVVVKEEDKKDGGGTSTTSSLTQGGGGGGGGAGGGLFSFSGIYNMKGFSSVSKSCVTDTESNVCKTVELKNGKKKTIIVTKRCCHGYSQKHPSGPCEKMHLMDLVETLKEVKCGSFYNMSVISGIGNIFRDSNLTIFCPNDEALDELDQENNDIDVDEIPLSRRRRRAAKNGLSYLIQNHLVSGFVRRSEFKDQESLQTLNENDKLRTVIYRFPLTVSTVNCARITSSDIFAKNGIIHKVDRVLKPVTETVADIITKNGDLSIFKKLISQVGLLNLLRDTTSTLTIFAPTDSAFEKSGINIADLETSGCIDALVKNLVMKNIVCATAINGRVWGRNLLGNKLKMYRKEVDSKLFIGDEAQVTVRDLMGTNGVVHIVDGVPLPSESQNLLQILKEKTYPSLSDAVDQQLYSEMNFNANSTFFVPHKNTFQAAMNDSDVTKDTIKDILLYHTIETGKQVQNMADNEIVKAKNGKPIRFNRYRFGATTKITAQCVPILDASMDICPGAVQSLSGIMKPGDGTFFQFMDKEEKYSIMNKILKKSDISASFKPDVPYTYLVVPDYILERYISQNSLDLYLEDEKSAKSFISRYIIPKMLCCAGINGYYDVFFNKVKSIGGDSHSMSRSLQDDVPKIGGAKIVGCDHMVKDGVIHELLRPITKTTFSFCFFGC